MARSLIIHYNCLAIATIIFLSNWKVDSSFIAWRTPPPLKNNLIRRWNAKHSRQATAKAESLGNVRGKPNLEERWSLLDFELTSSRWGGGGKLASIDRQKNKERASIAGPVEHARHERWPRVRQLIHYGLFIYRTVSWVPPPLNHRDLREGLGPGRKRRSVELRRPLINQRRSASDPRPNCSVPLCNRWKPRDRAARSFLTSSRVRGDAFCFTPRFSAEFSDRHADRTRWQWQQRRRRRRG